MIGREVIYQRNRSNNNANYNMTLNAEGARLGVHCVRQPIKICGKQGLKRTKQHHAGDRKTTTTTTLSFSTSHFRMVAPPCVIN